MKRPLLPVALCYVGGLLLANTVQVPLFSLFAACFGVLLVALLSVRTRNLLLWPLLILVGWTNLTQRTAILSPYDLRLVAGQPPLLTTLRGTLAETPSLRLNERDGKEFARTLVPLDVTALAADGNTQCRDREQRPMTPRGAVPERLAVRHNGETRSLNGSSSGRIQSPSRLNANTTSTG